MFKFINKVDVIEECFMYYFDVLEPDYFKIGTAIIMVGSGRHDASLIFDEDITIIDAIPYIENFRELLDSDLIKIDEPHERIVLAEICYKWQTGLNLSR